jgi:thiol-disulfide isomerase/thioredoxin
VAKRFGGKVRFVVENYGASPLATRFGVKRYPAIFVDDVLVATPKDFGFYGRGEGDNSGGRYAPFPGAAGEERLRADLARIIALTLAGHKDAARAEAHPEQGGEIAALPAVTFDGLDGRHVATSDLRGHVVAVEIWATWCVPCRGTLDWLGKLKARYGDRLTVVTVAVQSDETGVRALAGDPHLPFLWTLGTPDLVRALGDVSAVPTLLLFDRDGRTAATFFGAPPSLHGDAEARLDALMR